MEITIWIRVVGPSGVMPMYMKPVYSGIPRIGDYISLNEFGFHMIESTVWIDGLANIYLKDYTCDTVPGEINQMKRLANVGFLR